MSKNHEKLILVGVFVLIAAFVFKKNFQKKELTSLPQGNANPSLNSNQNSQLPDSNISSRPPSIQDLQPPISGVLDKSPKIAPKPPASAESKVLVSQFQNEARLEIPSELQNMEFQKIPDIGGNGTVGILGKSELDGTTLATISRPGPPDLNKTKEYILDDLAEALKMDITAKSLEKPQSLPPPEGSGFSSIQSWTIKEDGRIAVITLATRTDNSGTYLNVFTGPAEELEKNEEHYDDMLSKFKSK